MAQIIRVFPTPGAAQAACDELTRSGFTSVETVEVPDRRERGSRDNSAVVRVEAPFLTALKATAILERNGGKEAGPQAILPSTDQPTERPATPVNGTPAAASPLPRDAELRTGPRTLSSLLGIPELISSDTFFSGFPLLIRPKPRHDENAVPSEDSRTRARSN